MKKYGEEMKISQAQVTIVAFMEFYNKNIPKSSVKGSEKGSEKSSVKIIELIKEASVVRLTLLDIWLLGKAAFIRCLPMRIKYKGISDALH